MDLNYCSNRFTWQYDLFVKNNSCHFQTPEFTNILPRYLLFLLRSDIRSNEEAFRYIMN